MRFTFLLFIFFVSCNKNVDNSNDIKNKVLYYNERFTYFQRNSIDTAQMYIDSIHIISKQPPYLFGIAIMHLNTGLLEQVRANYHTALQHNNIALKEFKILKDEKYIAKTYAAIGSNYWQLGSLDSAMHYFIDALKINERLKLNNETAACNNYISMVYQIKEQIALAEKYAQKAYNIIKSEKINSSHISIYHNLANIYGMEAKYTNALKMDSIGLVLCEQLNNEFNKSMFYDNIANCYYFMNDFDKSLEYHYKAIDIDATFGNEKQLGDSYFNIAAIYDAKGDYANAILHINKSIQLCKNSDYKTGLYNAYNQLAKIYYKQHNLDLAYQMLQTSIVYKDSLINKNTENKIVELQTLYETEHQQQQITQQALTISRRNIFIFMLFTLLFLAVLTFYIIYNRNKIKQERILQDELIKEQEKRTNAILQTEENERQRLARELHDGVGQLLSATKLNLQTLKEHKSEFDIAKINQIDVVLDESIKEIRNISHNMMPDILLKKGLMSALDIFTATINQTKKISVQFECNSFDENSLNVTEKLMLYRIIQETINNTIKYAVATNFELQLSADENEITLFMQDNGKGFDVKSINQKNGIGLRNIQLRTAYLNGKLEIESSAQNGTTTIIEIPLQKNK